MNIPAYPYGHGPVGAIIAIIVLIFAIVLGVTHEIGQWLALGAGALAIARLT